MLRRGPARTAAAVRGARCHGVSRHEIREALDQETVRVLQVMQLALTMGVLLFTAFTVARAWLFPARGPGTSLAPAALRTLTTANAAVLLGAFAFGHLIFRSRLSFRSRNVAASVAALRAAILLRLALLEGAALFGVVVCFLATGSGPPADPRVWLNLASPAAFLLFSAVTFPTRERLAALLSDRG